MIPITVDDPTDPTRKLTTHEAVAHVGCRDCSVAAGIPCRGERGGYVQETHASRRDDYRLARRRDKGDKKPGGAP